MITEQNGWPNIETVEDYERYQEAFARGVAGYEIACAVAEYRHTYRCNEPDCVRRETELVCFDADAPASTTCDWCDGQALLVEPDLYGDYSAGFSWLPCDICQRALGGDRQHFALTNPSEEEVVYVQACWDCVYYAEYGHLNDSTMLELEKQGWRDDRDN